jgi:hypothetical protein
MMLANAGHNFLQNKFGQKRDRKPSRKHSDKQGLESNRKRKIR